jgi:hypothetical protein
MVTAREYWMYYRGPGFLAVVWFGPPPLSLSSVNTTGDTQEEGERETTDGRGGRGGGKEPNYRESLVLYNTLNILLSYNHLFQEPQVGLRVN